MKVRQPPRRAAREGAAVTEARVSHSDKRKEDMKNPAKQSVSWHDPILFGVTIH
jgi:hypothetical protein